MSETIKREEQILCQALSEVLKGEDFAWPEKKISMIAGEHKVLTLLYDCVAKSEVVDEKEKKLLQQKAAEVIQQNYRLFFLTKYIMTELDKKGIESVLLKGASIARLYPVPELRKSGDVDLLLRDREAVEKAGNYLEQMGMRKNTESWASHHLSYRSVEGIEIELHYRLCEQTDSKEVNDFLEGFVGECMDTAEKKEMYANELKVLSVGNQAFHLLLHMEEHFMRSGFGLKLLCDWVVFWNRQEIEEAERQKFFDKIQKCRLTKFAKMVTMVCIQYLGLEQKKVAFFVENQKLDNRKTELFLREILDAGEFGKADAERMVVVKGTSLKAYAKEFHHQMCLNHPRASRYKICYPILWLMTFFGFIYRNHSKRKISTIGVLKKSAKRGKLMKEIGLTDRYNK